MGHLSQAAGAMRREVDGHRGHACQPGQRHQRNQALARGRWVIITTMNIERFKQRLREKEIELQSDIARLKAEARVSGEAEVGDLADAATSSAGLAESLQEDTLAAQTLIQVQDALHRIEDGTYGKCIACGRPIETAGTGVRALLVAAGEQEDIRPFFA